MLIGQALGWASKVLATAGIDTARLDAEVLLAEVMRVDRTYLFSHSQDVLAGDQEELFRIWIYRRYQGLPVAYILGKKEFWSLEILVTPAVLIPRPESELLVEGALERTARAGPTPLIAEVGCGSGAVIISLARELGRGRFYATDSCPFALWIARQNAHRLQVADRISFLRTDLLRGVIGKGWHGRFDQVLSNPPYVPRQEVRSLPREVRLYEPRRALDGGEDGLYFHRRLLPEAICLLKPGGYLLMEIGQGQCQAVLSLLDEEKALAEVEVLRDYRGIERVVCARKG